MHFPFCRGKCAYCALFSRGGVAKEERDQYALKMASALERIIESGVGQVFSTVYFGGGTPTLCDLGKVFERLSPLLLPDAEVSVELHPLDVNDELLSFLRAGGVNRVSMGVQSLDDATLADMRRGYTFEQAAEAFKRVKAFFDNAGIDLIVGYPPPQGAKKRDIEKIASWGARHCSVYSLQLEKGTTLAERVGGDKKLILPSDDEMMDALRQIDKSLSAMGFERYEISNWAQKGFECRHNCAVWRGEDYLGLGEGAYGRRGLMRTRDAWGLDAEDSGVVETLSPETDRTERLLFRLRTREGIDIAERPECKRALDRFVEEGLVSLSGRNYRLTSRGMEVCDSVLLELI
jgi:oxygen-independent coproporphyrinogen-3 oxidase